ncbi:MAG: DUF1015 family protein, partial [Planctomycetota bacterium]
LDPVQQRDLYRQHPCNTIRLIRNREEPGDQSVEDRVTRAEDFWRIWRREGILIREHAAAFYVIQSLFRTGECQQSRWSLIARMSLPGSVPEAVVNPVAVSEKRSLRARCEAEFSPVTVILATEQEPEEPLEDILERTVRLKTPLEHIDESGQHHRIWQVIDKATQVRLEHSASVYTGFLADGLTEFVAALQHRDSVLEQGQGADPNNPVHAVLAWLIPSTAEIEAFRPVLYPIVQTRGVSAASLTCSPSDGLVLQYVGNEASACDDSTELAALNEQQPCLAFGTADGHWGLAAAANPETTCSELRGMLQRLITRIASDAASGPAIKTGYSAEILSMLVAREFRKSEDQVLIIQPARCVADQLLNHVMEINQPTAWTSIADISVAAPLPVGIVFSSLESAS